MHIGKLDRIVTIQQVSRAANSYSDRRTETWSNYATGVPASRDYPGRTSGADEVFEVRQKVGKQVNVWVIRYDSGVTKDMRLLYNSEYYYIIRLKEMGRSRYMEVTTELRDN